MAETPKLDAHHRATVERILSHPTSHNIEWHDVVSLSETETFRAPRSGDIDAQQVVDLRRMLKSAGIHAGEG
jgi:hypothetical protein